MLQYLLNFTLTLLQKSINYGLSEADLFPPTRLEKKQSSAEVDIVIQYKSVVIPIEIKSGKQGKLKSLHQFIELSEHSYAIRMYAGEFKVEEHTTPNGKHYYLMNLPYYLGTKLKESIDCFVSHYGI